MPNNEKPETEEEKKEHLEKKRQRIANFRKNHPRGTCLLARDTPHNRKLFPDGPFGKTRGCPESYISWFDAWMLTIVFRFPHFETR